MTSSPTVLSSLPRVIVETVSTYQVDVDAMLAAAGAEPSSFSSAAPRVSDSVVRRLWTVAVARTGNPCLGLATARHHYGTSFHALGFAFVASPTLGDMLKRLIRYERVLKSDAWASLERRSGCTAVRLQLNPDHEPASSCRADAAFAALLRWGRDLTGTDFKPAAVEFRHGDHGQRQRYEETFGTTLSFGADADRFWFEDTVLTQPLPGASPALAAEADRIVEAYLARADGAATTLRVRQCLLELLPQGEATLERVAQTLHLSARSLQRHLGDEGYSFRAVLDETRKSVAIESLRAGNEALADVAFRIGFSDQSAFSKAFKRWTGLSPAAFALSCRNG